MLFQFYKRNGLAPGFSFLKKNDTSCTSCAFMQNTSCTSCAKRLDNHLFLFYYAHEVQDVHEVYEVQEAHDVHGVQEVHELHKRRRARKPTTFRWWLVNTHDSSGGNKHEVIKIHCIYQRKRRYWENICLL